VNRRWIENKQEEKLPYHVQINQPLLALLCFSWLLSNENEEEKHQARRIEERDCYQFLLTEEMTNTGGSSGGVGLQRCLCSPSRDRLEAKHKGVGEQNRGRAKEERPATETHDTHGRRNSLIHSMVHIK
jgi:hypothetical protein